jgi:hypothetical protein
MNHTRTGYTSAPHPQHPGVQIAFTISYFTDPRTSRQGNKETYDLTIPKDSLQHLNRETLLVKLIQRAKPMGLGLHPDLRNLPLRPSENSRSTWQRGRRPRTSKRYQRKVIQSLISFPFSLARETMAIMKSLLRSSSENYLPKEPPRITERRAIQKDKGDVWC